MKKMDKSADLNVEYKHDIKDDSTQSQGSMHIYWLMITVTKV